MVSRILSPTKHTSRTAEVGIEFEIGYSIAVIVLRIVEMESTLTFSWKHEQVLQWASVEHLLVEITSVNYEISKILSLLGSDKNSSISDVSTGS